jgi:SAM-dependent methyltransferase
MSAARRGLRSFWYLAAAHSQRGDPGDGRMSGYLLDGQDSELERLQLQSRVWEPAGQALIAELGDGAGLRAVDIGCGALGWLRVLADWVGPTGEVVGTDVDEHLLAAAGMVVEDGRLANVVLQRDDLFASALSPASFNLVHARFQLAPLGRVAEQLAAYAALLRPNGMLVLEEPDAASWRLHPEAPATDRLIALILEAFRAAGGDFDAGRRLPGLLDSLGARPTVRAHVLALEPGHPYLKLPLQFAAAMRPRLESVLTPAGCDALLDVVDGEMAAPGRWGTTFTLIQAWGRVPGGS